MIVSPEAVTAAANAMLTAEYADDPGPAGAYYRARARIALEAAAPLIAADSHRVWLEHVIGYQVDGKIYHPSDVQIVLRSEP